MCGLDCEQNNVGVPLEGLRADDVVPANAELRLFPPSNPTLVCMGWVPAASEIRLEGLNADTRIHFERLPAAQVQVSKSSGNMLLLLDTVCACVGAFKRLCTCCSASSRRFSASACSCCTFAWRASSLVLLAAP